MQARSIALFAGIILALALGGWALAAARSGDGKAATAPVFDAPRGERCVRDAEFMRRNHMELLRAQRDETVHLGKRDAERGLRGCIECHAGASTGTVLGETGFCESCHRYAAVRIDCFECHSPKAAKLGQKSAS